MSKGLAKLLDEATALERATWGDFWRVVAECGSILRELDPQRRRPWLAVVIQELHVAQEGKCAICREEITPQEWEVDHRIPFCHGGGNEPANLQLAHLRCNRGKGSQVEPLDLLRYLEGRYLNL